MIDNFNNFLNVEMDNCQNFNPMTLKFVFHMEMAQQLML